MKKQTYSIGFDLGGTKLAAALLDKDGKMLDFIKVPVDMSREKSATKTQARVIQLMVDIAVDFKNRFPQQTKAQCFKGVGLASAGPMNVEEGKLTYPVNYPGWKIVPIRALLEKGLKQAGFKTAVFFQHDATSAALAEGWVGGAQKLNSFAVVSIGTGIGTGIIFNGKPAQSGGMGSENGHIVVDIRQLQKNPDELRYCTVEGFASGTALLRRAREMGFHGTSVEDLVNHGDAKYQVLYEDMAWALACLCYDLSIGYNLEKIFLSGGLIKIRSLYLKNLKTNYSKLIRQFNPRFECAIEIAKTQNHAGVLGAGYLPYL